MTIETITMMPDPIVNPREPRHFMRIKPVSGTVRITVDDWLLAQSDNAVRVLEVGREMYDPVLYLPMASVKVRLARSSAPTTHCPIKGEASYFDLIDQDGSILSEKAAWSYEYTFGFARQLEDRIAFYADRVDIHLLRTLSTIDNPPN